MAHAHVKSTYDATIANRRDVREQFVADRDRLIAIRDEASWTNAKRDDALKDLAKISRRMLVQLRDL